MTVLRSTWNYPLRPEDFLSWLEGVAAVSELWNPLPVVRWNLHKGYLLELQAGGVPVTPTEIVEHGASRRLVDVKSERGWDDVVVKPAVSANSMNTIRVAGADLDRGEAHLRALSARADVLVQPYLKSVEEHGERSVIWIDGEWTHAIRKNPRFVGRGEAVSKSALAIGAAEADLAAQALDFVRGSLAQPLLYARVDMAPGRDGLPVVMELELVEPSLYFLQSERALARFVLAIRKRLWEKR